MDTPHGRNAQSLSSLGISENSLIKNVFFPKEFLKHICKALLQMPELERRNKHSPCSHSQHCLRNEQ